MFNDTEQYHTGRAAAYDTMGHFLDLLLRRGGEIRRDEVRELRDMAYKRQMEAEESASRTTSATPGV